MNDDMVVRAILYGLLLLLPLSALAGRRLHWRRSAAMTLGWLAIFGLVSLIFVERARFAIIGNDIRDAFDPEGGERSGTTVRVRIAEDGHFWIRANVNGVATRFLVDSGATTIAIGTATAARTGIASSRLSIGVPIQTANGVVIARRGSIERLSVAGIERRDLGVVIAPEFGDTNVLGMNFLSSLSGWSADDGTFTLRP